MHAIIVVISTLIFAEAAALAAYVFAVEVIAKLPRICAALRREA